MNDISQIGAHVNPDPVQPAGVEKPGRSEPAAREAAGELRADQAEFSELGQLLGRALELPDVRAEKVSQARQEIARDADA